MTENDGRPLPTAGFRIRLHEGDPGAVMQFSMDCVLDLDWEEAPIGVELISPRAIAEAKGLPFDGDVTAKNAMEQTSYDADADAMGISMGTGRSIDQRVGIATLLLSPSGQVLELIVR